MVKYVNSDDADQIQKRSLIRPVIFTVIVSNDCEWTVFSMASCRRSHRKIPISSFNWFFMIDVSKFMCAGRCKKKEIHLIRFFLATLSSFFIIERFWIGSVGNWFLPMHKLKCKQVKSPVFICLNFYIKDNNSHQLESEIKPMRWNFYFKTSDKHNDWLCGQRTEHFSSPFGGKSNKIDCWRASFFKITILIAQITSLVWLWKRFKRFHFKMRQI